MVLAFCIILSYFNTLYQLLWHPQLQNKLNQSNTLLNRSELQVGIKTDLFDKKTDIDMLKQTQLATVEQEGA